MPRRRHPTSTFCPPPAIAKARSSLQAGSFSRACRIACLTCMPLGTAFLLPCCRGRRGVAFVHGHELRFAQRGFRPSAVHLSAVLATPSHLYPCRANHQPGALTPAVLGRQCRPRRRPRRTGPDTNTSALGRLGVVDVALGRHPLRGHADQQVLPHVAQRRGAELQPGIGLVDRTAGVEQFPLGLTRPLHRARPSKALRELDDRPSATLGCAAPFSIP